jgi:hypothetical protein
MLLHQRLQLLLKAFLEVDFASEISDLHPLTGIFRTAESGCHLLGIAAAVA